VHRADVTALKTVLYVSCSVVLNYFSCMGVYVWVFW
jgi:hypothetical protein